MINTDNIFNTLYCENELFLPTIKKMADTTIVRGCLINIPPKEIPVIFIELSPNFGIKNDDFDEKMSFLNTICKKCNILPYLTFLYKDDIQLKNRSTDTLFGFYYELDYIMYNVYQQNNKILLVYFGNFSDFTNVNSMIHSNKTEKDIQYINVNKISKCFEDKKYINIISNKISAKLRAMQNGN